jgi:hypothetical protein
MNTKEAVTFSDVRTISGVAGLSSVDSRINVTVEGKFDSVEEARLLIQAAPDLLAALKDTLEAMDSLHPDGYGLTDPGDAAKQARVAISKAEGN